MSDCLVCREIAGEIEVPGGFLLAEEQVLAWHGWPLEPTPDPRAYLGHLMLVPRRHAPGWGDLKPDEAAAVGSAVARLARVLAEEPDVERVYTATIGHHVDHLHVHVFPRYRSTPEEVRWFDVNDWEHAPHGDFAEVAAFVERLRVRL